MRLGSKRWPAAAVVGLALLMPAAAAADDPPAPACPTVAIAYEGTDDVVREVRQLRDDVRSTCLTLRDGAALAHDDATAAADDADRAHDDATALQAAVADAADAPPPPSSTVELSADDADRAAATVLGLGLIGGLLCVQLLLPAIRRYWT